MAKVLRVNPSTGAGAPKNPFAQAPLVYTYGRRNPQGLARVALASQPPESWPNRTPKQPELSARL